MYEIFLYDMATFFSPHLKNTHTPTHTRFVKEISKPGVHSFLGYLITLFKCDGYVVLNVIIIIAHYELKSTWKEATAIYLGILVLAHSFPEGTEENRRNQSHSNWPVD
jgi:hypothetical protein